MRSAHFNILRFIMNLSILLRTTVKKKTIENIQLKDFVFCLFDKKQIITKCFKLKKNNRFHYEVSVSVSMVFQTLGAAVKMSFLRQATKLLSLFQTESAMTLSYHENLLALVSIKAFILLSPTIFLQCTNTAKPKQLTLKDYECFILLAVSSNVSLFVDALSVISYSLPDLVLFNILA